MSANILLLNLAGERSEHQPDFAVAVNAPLSLADAAVKLDAGFNKVYGLHFTKELSSQHNLKKWPISIGAFDEAFTAPRAGYPTAKAYYDHCSAIKYVEKIEVPTLVLSAEDDPFIMSQHYRDARWPKSVCLRMEKNGGHLGYIQKSKTAQIRWMDQYLSFIVTNV